MKNIFVFFCLISLLLISGCGSQNAVEPEESDGQSAIVDTTAPDEETIIIVTGDNLAIRNTPGTKDKSPEDVLKRVGTGQFLVLVRDHNNEVTADGHTWWEVYSKASGTAGWVAASYVSISEFTSEDIGLLNNVYGSWHIEQEDADTWLHFEEGVMRLVSAIKNGHIFWVTYDYQIAEINVQDDTIIYNFFKRHTEDYDDTTYTEEINTLNKLVFLSVDKISFTLNYGDTGQNEIILTRTEGNMILSR